MGLKIRFEHTRYPHWGQRSGYIQFAAQLDPMRYHVSVHAASDSDDDLAPWLVPFTPWLRRLIKRGRMPWYKLSDLNAELAALWDGLQGRFHVIHFLDGEHSGQFLPRLIKTAGLSIRTVATFHQPPKVAKKIVNGELLQWLDRIVLVSPSQLEFFKQYVPDDKLHVLLHGVDTDFFYPTQRLPARKRIRSLTAGHWLRDWDTFKSVARTMSDITFDVVTNRKIDFEGLPNVIPHNGISDAALAELYRTSDILFLPLIDSTANNTLLEGIASGLPVVTTDLEAVRTYLPKDEGILVVGNRIKDFIDAIRRLQHDVELRQRMGRQARERAEELAWSRLVRDYEAFYDGLVPTSFGPS